jgi:hypothetical protein
MKYPIISALIVLLVIMIGMVSLQAGATEVNEGRSTCYWVGKTLYCRDY